MRARSDGTTLISLYHFFCGLLALLGMCAVGGVPLLVGLAAHQDPDGPVETAVIGLVVLLLGGLCLLVAVANGIVGWGLCQRRDWARLVAVGLAFFRMLNIPLGTLIGGLIIWYLLREDVKVEFSVRD